MSHRGWSDEPEAKATIEDRYGDLLDAMADLRNRAYEELRAAGISTDSLHGYRAHLLLIFTRAMGAVDAVRILAEHG